MVVLVTDCLLIDAEKLGYYALYVIEIENVGLRLECGGACMLMEAISRFEHSFCLGSKVGNCLLLLDPPCFGRLLLVVFKVFDGVLKLLLYFVLVKRHFANYIIFPMSSRVVNYIVKP